MPFVLGIQNKIKIINKPVTVNNGIFRVCECVCVCVCVCMYFRMLVVVFVSTHNGTSFMVQFVSAFS
jgi:hypothetical protein